MLEDAITTVLAIIEPKGAALASLRPRAVTEIFCGYSLAGKGQGSIALSSDLLARIAALGLDVVFDLYE